MTGTINSEFTIDGSSNIVSGARVGIQPPSDSIQEFKVETAVYDAQIGHTGAGNVNLALKSGTNQWHGAGIVLQPRRHPLGQRCLRRTATAPACTPRDYNRFSATLSGPIFRNRTFFMFSYEKLQDDTIETVTNSVPTERMRNGDFSELLAIGVQIFDPATARLVNGVVDARSVPRQHHSAQPHQPDRRQRARATFRPRIRRPRRTCRNNFFAEQPWTYAYNLQMTRIDHEWTPNHRTYGRFIRNFRREERHNFAGEHQRRRDLARRTDRFNYNYAVGHTAVLSPSLFLDVKGSWLRFNDDLQPIGQLEPVGARAIRPARWRCSATTRTFRASRSSRAIRPPPAAWSRSARSRAASTPAAAAVLQHAVHADADLDARQPHVEGRLRLAATAADGNQRRLAWRAPTRSTAPTPVRRARPSASSARGSRRSCSASR